MEFLFFCNLQKHMLWNLHCSSINVEVTKCSKSITEQILLCFSLHCTTAHICTVSSKLEHKLLPSDKNSALCIRAPSHIFQSFFLISKKNVFRHKSYFSKPLQVPKQSPGRQITPHPTRRNDAPPISCSVPCFVCLRVPRSDPAPEKKQSQRLVILRAEAAGGSRSTGLKQHGWEMYHSIILLNHHT